MGQNLSPSGANAICSTLGNKGNSSNTLATENEDWFAPVAWEILGKEAGLHLHYITGWPLSSCYAFVAKDAEKRRKLHHQFLRALLHSDQGEPFHTALMDGCTAPWWLEMQHQRRVGAAAIVEITKRE